MINIASGLAFKGAPGLMHYAASKGAVVNLTRSMAQAVGHTGITVNAIAPGGTASPTLLAVQPKAGVGEIQRRSIKRVIVGTPETVTRKLRQVIERLHPGCLHIYGNEGAMHHQDVMRSIELLGKEVIPARHEVQLPEYYE